MKNIISVNQLNLNNEEKSICNNLDWVIQPGQVWGVLGQNGVGKSTLLHALCGLRKADSGTIHLGNQSMPAMNRRSVSKMVGFLFQHQDDVFPTTVHEQVMMGRHPHISYWKGEQPDDLKLVESALLEMGLNGMESRRLNTLSGGERRRVAIATILAQKPELYLLDEPEAHLDPSHQKVIFQQIMSRASDNKISIVMALHDINLAIHHCSHLLFMFGKGEISQGTIKEMATKSNIERLYGTSMTCFEKEGRIAYLVQ